jgi:hypothetical protein
MKGGRKVRDGCGLEWKGSDAKKKKKIENTTVTAIS